MAPGLSPDSSRTDQCKPDTASRSNLNSSRLLSWISMLVLATNILPICEKRSYKKMERSNDTGEMTQDTIKNRRRLFIPQPRCWFHPTQLHQPHHQSSSFPEHNICRIVSSNLETKNKVPVHLQNPSSEMLYIFWGQFTYNPPNSLLCRLDKMYDDNNNNNHILQTCPTLPAQDRGESSGGLARYPEHGSVPFRFPGQRWHCEGGIKII